MLAIVVAGVLASWASFAAPSAASQAVDPVAPREPRGAPSVSRGGEAGNDANPITCWWRTDRTAVHVGERFTLALTCGILETAELRVVTDTDRLDPAALDLSPFEIVGGTRHQDIQQPPRRYFQYSYTIRMLGDESFGRDVDVPAIAIAYNVESSGVTGTRGRDQVYLLPALPVRVLSLVPVTADDIQDWSPETFGDIDRRMFRATGELAASGLLFAFAAVLAGVAVVRVTRPRLARAAAKPRLLLPAAVMRSCVREAERIKADISMSGWTVDLIDRALTVIRIAGAIAIGRPVAQRVVNTRVAVQEGQLAIRRGRLSTQRILVSGATTAPLVAASVIAGEEGALDPRLRLVVDDLSEALRVFGAARYGRPAELKSSELDAALETGLRALHRLHERQQWRARASDALSRTVERVRTVLVDR
jgi:hypothetical protein